MRVLWGLAGLLALLLGAVGAVLPIMPTVPFVLLAAFCFSRSSERMHQWLVEHPIFGPGIQNWRKHGAISQRAKLIATISMLGSVVLGLALALPPAALAAQIFALSGALIFIWTRPTGSPREASKGRQADRETGIE